MPNSWAWTTVNDISKSILYGVSESAKTEGKYKLLRITDIQDNQVDWENVPYADFNEDKVSSYILHDGDIVFARTGATVGKSYLIKGLRQKAIYASYLIRVQTFDLILPEYVKLFFESGYYWEQIKLGSVGIGQPNVNGTILGNLNIPLPPFTEQKRIVIETERLFSLIDIIEKGRTNICADIKHVKSKILDLAVHGKLVPQNPADEPANELLRRINPNAEITCDNAHYGKLPEGWCFSKLGSVGVWQSGGTPSRSSPAYYNGVIPWLKIADLPDGYVTNCSEKISHDAINNSSAKVNPEGSVALAMYGSIGKLGILTFQAATNQAICVCSLFKGVDSKYLFYFLMSQREEFIRKAGGGVQSNISKDIIVNHPITLPPLAEQLKIVAKIERLFSVLNSISFSLQE